VSASVLDAAAVFPPLSIAALSLLIGIVALLAYNLLSVRVRLLAHDLERFSWDLLPLLDQLARPSTVARGAAAGEASPIEDDEFFRKKV
jgi:biopolymer transport protein ExbB/TolQ